nr:protein ALP1-like [Tanacetum cinerariifolium]
MFMVFRECLEVLIVCTGNGKIIQCYGKVNRVGVINKYPTIMLEAVASQDLWIWHAFYGITGANNDINVLDNSPLFDDLLDDLAHVVPYAVNGVEYRNGNESAERTGGSNHKPLIPFEDYRKSAVKEKAHTLLVVFRLLRLPHKPTAPTWELK